MEKSTEKMSEIRGNRAEKKAESRVKASKKKTNKTWEAFGKSKGCFIINDPKFLL